MYEGQNPFANNGQGALQGFDLHFLQNTQQYPSVEHIVYQQC